MLRVNLKANVNNNWETIEGALALFSDTFSWNATEEDATKFSNLDEEVSFMQTNIAMAIAMQSNPSATNELPIRFNNTRHTNYQWQFELTNYSGLTPYLLDTQTNTYTPITANTTVPFTVSGSVQTRFKIVFENALLHQNDFEKQVTIYPTPSKAGSSFYISGVTEAEVTLFNVLGQNIPVQTKVQDTTIAVTPQETLHQGVYLVNITQDGKTTQLKWIIE
jgi:hypothetical protein